MRRVVFILRGAVRDPSEHSVLRSSQDFEKLSGVSSVSVVSAAEPVSTPELAFLGLNPSLYDVSQGILTASAFKVDPPDKSTCFHLSLGALTEAGSVESTPPVPSQEEAKELAGLLGKLETKSLLPRWGDGLDHMLFWLEGSLELGTTPFSDSSSIDYANSLPEGDGESKLRRFIDDSVNVLLDTETNRRRIGDGVEPLNILWPWGQGMRTDYPNLAVKRGETARFESSDSRVSGLVRLFGYVHGDRAEFGKRLNPNLARLKEVVDQNQVTVCVFDHVGEASRLGRIDEAERMLLDLASTLVMDVARQKPVRLTVIALPAKPEEDLGLCLVRDSSAIVSNTMPFDERVLDDRRPERVTLWEAMVRALRP